MRISDWSSDVGSSDLLLNCLSRILNPTYGAVEYDGHDLLGRPVHRLSEIGVTRTFQNLELFGEGTVLENVVVGCFPRFRSNMISELLSLPSVSRARRAAYEEARQLIEELGLLPHIDTVVSRSEEHTSELQSLMTISY